MERPQDIQRALNETWLQASSGSNDSSYAGRIGNPGQTVCVVEFNYSGRLGSSFGSWSSLRIPRPDNSSTVAGHTQIVLLGTGTPRADPQRSGPATVVVVTGTPYLVDAGPGIVRRAAAAIRQRRQGPRGRESPDSIHHPST